MPLALDVFAAQRLAFLVEDRRVVLDPDVIEPAGAALEPHLGDRAGRIKKPRRLEPEHPRLKGIAVAANGYRLCHAQSAPSRKGGVGFMSASNSTARSKVTGRSG